MRPKNDAWFIALDSIKAECAWVQRTSEGLVISCVGYCMRNFEAEAEAAILPLGGRMLCGKFDKQCGRTIYEILEPKDVLAEREEEKRIEAAHEASEDCGVERCEECCPHDEYDHDECMDCGHERCPGEAIDRAMDSLEDR